MKEYSSLEVQKAGHVGIVTLRSAPVNTITFELLRDVEEAFQELENDSQVWVAVLCSSLKVFVAGADVNNLAAVRRPGGMETSRRFHEVFRQIERFPHPVICAVNGIAFGGGLELALACNLRVFDGKAKVGFPEVGLGIIPGAGGTQRLTKLVGAGAARRLIYTGETVGAEEAFRLGLCEYLAESGRGIEKAMEIAQAISAKAPLAVAAAKKCITFAGEHTLEDGLEYECGISGDVFETADKAEGATAFLEKRQAVFQNK